MMSRYTRRASIVPCGVDHLSANSLLAHDESFYGEEEDDVVDTSSSDDEETASGSPRKRVARGQLFAAEDSDSDEAIEFESLNESFLSLQDYTDPTSTEVERALIAAEISDWKSSATGCRCKGTSCYGKLDSDKLENLVYSLRNISKVSRKQYLVGQLAASMRTTAASAKEREYYFSHHLLGNVVCKTAFLAITGLGEHVYRQLRSVAEQCNAEVPAHGSAGGLPHNAISAERAEQVTAFIRNSAAVHGLPQPAAPRGRAEVAPIYLPTAHNKKTVYQEYEKVIGSEDAVSYKTFCKLWNVHAPDVIVMKPRTDVCVHCDRHREQIKFARNEEEFSAASKALASHLESARDERAYYRDTIDTAKEDNETCHLTFDFAKQLELPQHSRQVGPIYFKVRFRVQLFGICNEAEKQQHNYFFHEGQSIGTDGSKAHGPNAVISMLDNYLSKHCAGKKNLLLHADNCVGQNKNKTVIGYLLWRTMTGRNDTIELSFMRVGHTRCSVDGYFGLLKQSYRANDVDTMDDVVRVIDASCVANHAVPFDWSWRPWDDFMSAYFNPIKGIRKFQHFRVSSAEPGVVHVRDSCLDMEHTIKLMKPGVDSVPADLPNPVAPPGISELRLKYLDKQIAEHLTQQADAPWR